MALKKKLTSEDFINHPKVALCLERLHAKFPAGTNKELLVSDVLDDKGYQYVNLVQKGGGVLGVALVGYTYILEEMGIRFLKQAGTSAGAINTALMTAVGTKQDAKSKTILDAICGLSFFSLVDGHPAARWLIGKFIRNNNFVARVKRFIVCMIAALAIFIAGDIVLTGLQHKIPQLSFWAGLCFVITGIIILFFLSAAMYASSLMTRLKNAGFGINPGNFFFNWIDGQLKFHGVHTVSDLNNKASSPVPGIHLRMQSDQGTDDLKGTVTFIASELVTQNKIQFPAMCNLFRTAANIDELPPAGFVRASMSIPLFFESYMIDNIPCDDEEVKKAWAELSVKEVPSTARFVDGGILSNFPVSLFYNPAVVTPRLPVFGIDLDDSIPQDRSLSVAGWSIGGYMGRMFDTIRNYYDKDFLMKNRIYEQGIGTVHVSEFNWLNFFMADEEKIQLFVRGAEAAEKFLNDFNWYNYKGTRAVEEMGLTTKN